MADAPLMVTMTEARANKARRTSACDDDGSDGRKQKEETQKLLLSHERKESFLKS